MKQLSLFGTEEVRREIGVILNELDDDARAALLSSLMLDEIRKIINKFPIQYQKEMVAMLTDGFMEQWKNQEI